jgi:hypothetical protein
VTNVVVDQSKNPAPVSGGKVSAFEGPYQKIQGKAYGELDRRDGHNAIIQDIQLACAMRELGRV